MAEQSFKHGLSGYTNHKCRCDICRAASAAQARKYRTANLETRKAYGRAYYQANKDELRIKKAAYHLLNRDKKLAYGSAWQRANRDKARAAAARFRAKEGQAEKASATFAEYYKENRARLREYGAAWKKANSDKNRAAAARYRTRSLQAEVVENVYVKELVTRNGTDCHLCGKPVNMALVFPDRMAATIDHIKPLSRGGEHSYANTAIAHHACNSRKKDRYDEAS